MTIIPALYTLLRRLSCLLTALLLALTSCSPIEESRGHIKPKEIEGALSEDIHTKMQVRGILGSPSSTSAFGPETWYYISSRRETVAFFDPDIIEQEVLAITFNERDTIEDVRYYGLKDGQEVDIAERITPTEGQSITLFQQLLGNLGRFNTQRDALGR